MAMPSASTREPPLLHRARSFDLLPDRSDAVALLAELATTPCPFAPVLADRPLACTGREISAGWRTIFSKLPGLNAAFDGDSVQAFLTAHHGVVSKIHAFEPGPTQFAALKARAERLATQWQLKPGSLELINAGLGDVDTRARGDSGNGPLTSFAIGHDVGANGVAVEIVSLDRHLNGGPLSFLKADVEGMELALLRGAQATIRRHRPKIAVCAYHYPTDIPELARSLGALVPDYRFALRHHAPELMETVLYCWAH